VCRVVPVKLDSLLNELCLDIQRAHTLVYAPYRPLEGPNAADLPGHAHVASIERHLAASGGEPAAALAESRALIDATLAGLRYLQTYDRFLIRAIVVLAYTGWIAFAGAHVLLPPAAEIAPGAGSPGVGGVVAVALLGAAWAAFAVQGKPGTYYAYVAFPVYFWYAALARAWGPARRRLQGRGVGLSEVGSWALRGGAVVAALLGMCVSSFHFARLGRNLAC
jgi:phosphatidylinositol glycan class N